MIRAVRIAALEFVGFDGLPPTEIEALKKNVPLHVGQPRDRKQVMVTRDTALNTLRDHGYPYAKGRMRAHTVGNRRTG